MARSDKQRLLALEFRLSRKKITEPFNFSQINSSVDKRSTSEFTCLCRTRQKGDKAARDPPRDDRGAMQMQLGAFFSGEALSVFKPKHQCLVQNVAFMPKRPKIGVTWQPQRTGQRFRPPNERRHRSVE